MTDMYFEAILKELKTKMDYLKEAVNLGRMKDMEEYRFNVGMIRGLTETYNYIESLSQHHEDN